MTRRSRAVQLPLPLEVPSLSAAVRAELRAEVIPGWGVRAACASRSVDPDWWHAPAGDELKDVARGVCEGCPVRRSCLAQALASGEPDGLWGGADESERVWMRLALAEGTRVASVLDPTSRTAAA
jgi:WhiB family transcriptional regulator, redox-sensing transcriptional regulator